MTLLFIRTFFFILCGIIGYYVGTIINQPILCAEIGSLCGLLLIFLEQRLHRVSVRGLSSMVFGLLLGVFMANIVSDILSLIPLGDFFQSIFRVVLTIIFSYIGTVMAFRGKDEFNIIIPYVRFRKQDLIEGVILLDTSVIIDGRISDIYKINFLNGRFVVPGFVLTELQKLADSADDLKRQRGRRGMELLHKMQSDPKVDIRIHETDFNIEGDVDSALVRLAKMLDARLCTTDFNLSRIASLQGVEVLNIQGLANALKSVVITGDKLTVNLIREGKEPNQALAYLDDGTMIVVNNAHDYIGQKVNVTISSILQIQSGKIIFAELS